MSGLTLLDIAKSRGTDAVVGLVDETTRATPELTGIHPLTRKQLPRVADARTIKGTMYKTLICTSLPSVGFRDANDGVASTKATYENRMVQTYIMNPRWFADKAVADASEDGWEVEMARAAEAHLKAAMIQNARQFYYGTRTTYGGAAKGFPGLLDSYDATNMVVDAGGSTADTGSSVWAVRFGTDAVRWVWGMNGAMEPSPISERDKVGANGQSFTAYHQELLAYPGLQVTSTLHIARIKKLTADNNCGLDDDKLADLIAKFEPDLQPDVIFLSRRSLTQLKKSRTATSDTGKAAPTPEDYEGIPLVPTRNISEVEALSL